MKKVTVILLPCVVVVCGVVAFKVWNSQPASLPQVPLAQAEIKPRPEVVPPAESIKELTLEEKLRISYQKTDESMAKLRQSSTPEIRAAIRKRHLEKTEQDYGAFFQNLDLEDAMVHQAVDILLERESKYLDIYDTLNETGMSKGIKAFGESRKIERSMAEVQLRHLLGDARYEALAQFEEERQAQIHVKAQKIISTHLND